MTPTELKIHDRLKQVSPSNYKHEHFINSLEKNRDKPMTEKGHLHMMKLLRTYRKQIPDWDDLQDAVINEHLSALSDEPASE